MLSAPRMECSVQQNGAGTAYISATHRGSASHLFAVCSHTPPDPSPSRADSFFTVIHSLFRPVPTPLPPPNHPLPLKDFLLFWFSCRRLCSVPCLAQHPLLPDTQTPSLSRPYAEQRHFLLLSIRPLQPHPSPVCSLQQHIRSGSCPAESSHTDNTGEPSLRLKLLLLIDYSFLPVHPKEQAHSGLRDVVARCPLLLKDSENICKAPLIFARTNLANQAPSNEFSSTHLPVTSSSSAKMHERGGEQKVFMISMLRVNSKRAGEDQR